MFPEHWQYFSRPRPRAVLQLPNDWQPFFLSSDWFLTNACPAPLRSPTSWTKTAEIVGCWSTMATGQPPIQRVPFSPTQHKATPFRGLFLWCPRSFEHASSFAAGKLIRLTLCHYKCIPGSLSFMGLTSPGRVYWDQVEKLGRPQNTERSDKDAKGCWGLSVLFWDKQKSFCHSSWIYRIPP